MFTMLKEQRLNIEGDFPIGKYIGGMYLSCRRVDAYNTRS